MPTPGDRQAVSNLQDLFLNGARRERLRVTVRLMDGTEVEMREGEHRIRTKLSWEGPIMVLEHHVVSGGRVRERLEVVGDRLIMTRIIMASGPGEPLVLAYNRT